MSTLRSLYGGVALTTLFGSALPAQTTAVSPEALARAVDSMAARVVATGISPGFGIAVVRDGRTLIARSYGWADASGHIPADGQTLWYVASTSKSFTGFGVALLAEQGLLDLHAPITALLPGVRWPEGVDASQLTVAHFLSHTHHLRDRAVVQSAAFTGAIPEEHWPELIRYAVPSGNNDLEYSNFGYNIAAMVIDRVRPEGWRRFLDSAVYRPTGMRETFARVSGLDQRRIAKPHDMGPMGSYVTLPFPKTDATMNSAGGHLATMSDLARWITVQMDSGRIDGRQVFPVEAVALSQRQIAPQTRDEAKRFGPFLREGWAAGWDIGRYRDDRMVSRFGSYMSTRSHLSMLPARRIGVVVQANGPIASGATDILAAFTYDFAAGRSDARAAAVRQLEALAARLPELRREAARSDSIRRSRQRPLRRPLSDYAGTYAAAAYGRVSFVARDGVLWFRWGVLEGPLEVYSAWRDQFRLELPDGGKVADFDLPLLSGRASAVEIGDLRFVRE